MNKRLRRLLNKKGITLVEIIVVLFVSSVLIGIAAGMLGPVTALMSSIKGNAHMDTMCDVANAYIRSAVQTASSVDFYDPVAVTETDIQNYVTSAGTTYKVYAIAVLKETVQDYRYPDDATKTLDQFRLYDFGKISNSSSAVDPAMSPLTLKNAVTDIASFADKNNYSVFRNNFYENTSYQLTFKANTTDVAGEGGAIEHYAKNIIVASTCLNADGEKANQPRELSFKLLNGDAKLNGTAVGSAGGEGAANGMLILYKVKDILSSLNHISVTGAPSPTPTVTTTADPAATTAAVPTPTTAAPPAPVITTAPPAVPGEVILVGTVNNNPYYLDFSSLSLKNNGGTVIDLTGYKIRFVFADATGDFSGFNMWSPSNTGKDITTEGSNTIVTFNLSGTIGANGTIQVGGGIGGVSASSINAALIH